MYLNKHILPSYIVFKNTVIRERWELFYLMMHSWLCGIEHMVKDHSEMTIAATSSATLFDWQQGFFYMYHPTDITYYSVCYTSRGALTGTKNSSMGPLRGIDQTTNRSMSGCSTRYKKVLS